MDAGLTDGPQAIEGPSTLAGHPIIVFEPQSVDGLALDTVLCAGGVTPTRSHVARFAATAIGLAAAS